MTIAKSKERNEESAEATQMNSHNTTAMNISREESRMNFRLASDIKKRVARAAALAGQDLTEFAVAALSEKADVIIERHDQTLLDSEDYNFFLDTLAETNVLEPSARSHAAAEKYRQGTRKGVRYILAD